jgi:hypothetical protein
MTVTGIGMIRPAITHPVYASLDHPLFAFGGKREVKLFDNRFDNFKKLSNLR